jgi:hypothetical protein
MTGTTSRELHALPLSSLLNDTVPPTVSCPANVVVEANNAGGAVVNYPPATATDNKTANPASPTARPRGTVFPWGTTTVTVMATDAAENQATCSFT